METPLHKATYKRHIEVVKTLLAHGANVDHQNEVHYNMFKE